MAIVRVAELDLVVRAQATFSDREFHFGDVVEHRHPGCRVALVVTWEVTQVSQVVATQRNVLGRRRDRLAARWREQIVRCKHQQTGFHLRFNRQRHVHRHLVTIEVRVVSGANQRVNPNRVTFDQLRFESLNRQAVQSRSTVQKDRVSPGHFVQDIPHFRCPALDHLLRAANRVHQAHLFQAANDEGFKQHQRHFLRKTALIELKIRSDNNDRTTRVIDALAEQVLPETTALAFQHVGKGLQRTVPRSSHRTAMATIVKQSVHRFLQHALLVTNDDIRRAQLQQVLQTVVPVDDPTVKIVQVGGRKATTFKRNQRPQIRRNDRKHFHDHRLRPRVA